MSLNFIHTADWHLGHTYWRIGPRAVESAQWRLDAVRRIWTLAQETGADFVLVAGDVFDTDTPSAIWRRHAVDLLADCPVPVYLIAGNHDPSAQGSVWFHDDFAGAIKTLGHVHLVTEAAPLEVADGVLLFPCPVDKKHDRSDATAWIPGEKRGQHYRLGLAHGHYKGYFSSGADQIYNVISNERAEAAGLDYLALGDYHSYTPADHAAAKNRTYYSGTPEIGAKDNVRGGHVLRVQLDSPGNSPCVEAAPVGRVRLVDCGIVNLSSDADFEAFQVRLNGNEAVEDSILRVKFSGHLAPKTISALHEWVGQARENWLGVDADLVQLYAQPTAADFAALRLESLEAVLIEKLSGELSPEYLVGVRGASEIAHFSHDEDARREALALYYRLLVEGK